MGGVSSCFVGVAVCGGWSSIEGEFGSICSNSLVRLGTRRMHIGEYRDLHLDSGHSFLQLGELHHLALHAILSMAGLDCSQVIDEEFFDIFVAADLASQGCHRRLQWLEVGLDQRVNIFWKTILICILHSFISSKNQNYYFKMLAGAVPGCWRTSTSRMT